MLKIFTICAAFVLTACTSPGFLPSAQASSPESEVASRLAQYTELIRHQDARALAAMFEPAGSMGHQGQPVIVGRSAIQAFLKSFAGYKVTTHEMRVLSVVVRGDVVRQTGTYAQTVLTPAGHTLHVAGRFAALWRRQSSGQWLIESMRTGPLSGG